MNLNANLFKTLAHITKNYRSRFVQQFTSYKNVRKVLVQNKDLIYSSFNWSNFTAIKIVLVSTQINQTFYSLITVK